MTRNILKVIVTPRFSVALEFKPQDLWIGAYWQKGHCWICLLPMLPLHFAYTPKDEVQP
jgi:hypothetical protein